jgi:hypothetical protein
MEAHAKNGAPKVCVRDILASSFLNRYLLYSSLSRVWRLTMGTATP